MDAGASTVFRAVKAIYADSAGTEVPNEALYVAAAKRVGVPLEEFKARTPIGKSGARHSRLTRTARFVQQTLKKRGLLEHAPGSRGVWRLTEEGKRLLHRVQRNAVLVAFSTRLGVMLWADARDAFRHLDEPIALALSSPPYLLKKPRDYGNPRTESEYVDFVVSSLEPIVKRLQRGGSIVLNVSNEIFVHRSPARSLYLERLTLALHDRLGLSLMDRLVWFNASKAPAPVQWASIKRVQLNVAYEPILWFTNDPSAVRSDNRRVLEEHSERHLALMAAGGERRHGEFANGAYRLRDGSFGKPTAGRIPRNVLQMGHRCLSQQAYKAAAAAANLHVHGAPYPLKLARFFVDFLTEAEDLVVDCFGGSGTTGLAAEQAGRRWAMSECMAEYARGAALRFSDSDSLWVNPELDQLLGLQTRKPQGELRLA